MLVSTRAWSAPDENGERRYLGDEFERVDPLDALRERPLNCRLVQGLVVATRRVAAGDELLAECRDWASAWARESALAVNYPPNPQDWGLDVPLMEEETAPPRAEAINATRRRWKRTAPPSRRAYRSWWRHAMARRRQRRLISGCDWN